MNTNKMWKSTMGTFIVRDWSTIGLQEHLKVCLSRLRQDVFKTGENYSSFKWVLVWVCV